MYMIDWAQDTQAEISTSLLISRSWWLMRCEVVQPSKGCNRHHMHTLAIRQRGGGSAGGWRLAVDGWIDYSGTSGSLLTPSSVAEAYFRHTWFLEWSRLASSWLSSRAHGSSASSVYPE